MMKIQRQSPSHIFMAYRNLPGLEAAIVQSHQSHPGKPITAWFGQAKKDPAKFGYIQFGLPPEKKRKPV